MESQDLNPAPGSSGSPEPLVEAPRWLGRWRWRVLLAAILIVPFFVPIPRVLERSVIISALGDRTHVVLLGGVAFFLYWYGPLRGRLLRAALAAAVVGGAIEGIQLFVGRHALWHDFFQDLIGIGIATGFVLWRGARSRPGLALLVVLLLLVPWQLREMPSKSAAARYVRVNFPLLADFQKGRDLLLWSDDYDAEVYWAVTEDDHGGVLRVETESKNTWPAGVMVRFPHDWSGYRSLRLDARIATDADSVRCGIVLTDHDGYGENVWKQINFWATPQWRTASIPLHDRVLKGTDRELDLTDVYMLKVYISRPGQHTVLEIDNVRLD